MASAKHGNTGGRKPSVWKDFDRVIVFVPGGTGAGAMAVCKRCGTTLQASAKKHGTSHLRRHAKSPCCAKRAAAAAAPAAGGDSDGGFTNWLEGVLLVEPQLDFADHLVIAGGDELVDAVAERAVAAPPAADDDSDGGFANWLEGVLVEPQLDFADRLIIAGGDELVDEVADVPAAGDHGRVSPNFIPDALPQAPASSSTRFFQKKKKRSASLPSQEGGTKDNDNSSRAKDWAPTVDNSTFDDMDFTASGDWE
ncbi:uncharacterized protein [Triticum aestivum]|uniref:uncharacterized protein n=1 Tax=Triticum aestivum TaxID=4565 RepID=UPI0008437E83|nr:uncharacterized protein LOC123072251 [Triticum aestivum]